MVSRLRISTVDYHTRASRFGSSQVGFARSPGGTSSRRDATRASALTTCAGMLIYEPRGHSDMYGCFVTAPEDEGADLGAVFFHNEGYSTACGHGTIALVTWAIDGGLVEAPDDGEAEVRIDVPSGRLRAVARVERGRVRSVRFHNVPSFVDGDPLEVEIARGRVKTVVSFGGAFYAQVEAAALGLAVEAGHLPELVELGRELKRCVEAARDVVHPLEPELRDVYGVIFFQDEEGPGELCQRNVAIFADGEVDRSPCGSGTSARLATLDATGRLPRGGTLVHRSIVGSQFTARVVGDAEVAGRPAVITEVEGSAYLCGFHHFVLEPDDPLGTGFLLR